MAKLKSKKTTSKPTPAKTGGIEDRIMAVQDVPFNVKMLVYGRSGTGKTSFTGSAPTPILILDCKDEGTNSVRNRKDTFVLPIETWQDFEDAYWYIQANPTKYKTIVVDTITALQDICLKELKPEGSNLVTKQTWGAVSGIMKTWLMNFRDLKMNVIFTAQDRATTTEDFEETGDIFPEIGPYTMPSISKTITAAVGFIGQTFIREYEKTIKIKNKPDKVKTVKEFCMRIGPHARYLTKFRTDHTADIPEVPAFIANPTFDDILKYAIPDEN